ncbi:MAG TPA: hypothetical protein VIH37_04685 [Candidatus Limnocylindrales bacterium]
MADPPVPGEADQQYRPGDTARLYHRLSSFTYVAGAGWPYQPADHPLVLQDFAPNHRPTFPAHRKQYPEDLAVVELPSDWPRVAVPALAVLAGQPGPPPVPLDLAGVARLLFLSAGVVRTAVRRDGRVFLFRPAGSAGGLFPIELYVVAKGITGLADGVHWYDPLDHALRQVGPAPTGEASAIVVTGIPWRTAWRYSERAFRHLYWDGGTMLANLLAVAESAGWSPRLWTRFPDATVARLVGADGTQEFPLAVVALGSGGPAIDATGPARSGKIDVAPVEFPLITAAQRAGDQDDLGPPWPPIPVLDHAPVPSDDLDAVILRRGSARQFVASAAVPRDVVTTTLTCGLNGAPVAHLVAVHAVEGIAPGIYAWPELGRPIRSGLLRRELWAVCDEQDLCRDAAFVAMAVVDLETLDDRGYREAQLAAGIAEGRLHLAAYALGIGASGMTFDDSELPALFGLPLAGLLFTCLGVTGRRTPRAGTPRHPTDVTR